MLHTSMKDIAVYMFVEVLREMAPPVELRGVYVVPLIEGQPPSVGDGDALPDATDRVDVVVWDEVCGEVAVAETPRDAETVAEELVVVVVTTAPMLLPLSSSTLR